MKYIFSFICRTNIKKKRFKKVTISTFEDDIRWNLRFRKVSKTVASNISVFDCLVYFRIEFNPHNPWTEAFPEVLPLCKNLHRVDGSAINITHYDDLVLPSVECLNVDVDRPDMRFLVKMFPNLIHLKLSIPRVNELAEYNSFDNVTSLEIDEIDCYCLDDISLLTTTHINRIIMNTPQIKKLKVDIKSITSPHAINIPTSLAALDVSNISVSFPKRCNNLKVIKLKDAHIRELPNDLVHLWALELVDCHVYEPLPNNLISLTYLTVKDTKFEFDLPKNAYTIPSTWTNLQRLELDDIVLNNIILHTTIIVPRLPKLHHLTVSNLILKCDWLHEIKNCKYNNCTMINDQT